MVCAYRDELYVSSAFVRSCSVANMDGCLLYINAQYFGSRCPPIPVATSITVARIASPVSLDKHAQNAILDSARLYFEVEKRLLKKGDIIYVPFYPNYGLLSDDIHDNLSVSDDIDNHLEQRQVDRLSYSYEQLTRLSPGHLSL